MRPTFVSLALALLLAMVPQLAGCLPSGGGTPSPTPAEQPIQVERHVDLDYDSLPIEIDGQDWIHSFAVWRGIQPEGDPFEFEADDGTGWLVLEAWNYHPDTLVLTLGDASTPDNIWPSYEYAPYWEYDGEYLYVAMDDWRTRWMAGHDSLPSELKIGILFNLPVVEGYFPQDYSQAGYRVHNKGGSTVSWPYNCGAIFPCWPSYNVGITWTLSNVPGDPTQTKLYAPVVDEPVAQYMLAWTHGDYTAESTGPDTALYSYVGDSRMAPLAEYMEADFDILKSFLGPYPQGRSEEGFEYAVAQVEWDKYGGMEHQPVTHVDGDNVSATNQNRNGVAAHEACHAWYSTSIRYGCPEDFVLSEGVCQYLGIVVHGMAIGGDSLEKQWADANGALDYYLNGHETVVSWPPTCGEVLVQDLFNNSGVYFRGAVMFYWYAKAIGGDEALMTLFGEYHDVAQGTAQYFENLLAFLHERTEIDPTRYAQRALQDPSLDDPRPDLEAYAAEDSAARELRELQCRVLGTCDGVYWLLHPNNPDRLEE